MQKYTNILTKYYNFSCSDLDAHPGMPNAPRAMVNLETWVPSNFEVDDWQVEDVGPLGSGGRSVGIYDHVQFSLKVRQIRNDFFKPMFLPKNERINSNLLLVDLFSFVFLEEK